MIEYLEKLLEDQDWHKGIAYAESLLKNADITPLELVKVHRLMGTFRQELGDYEGAISVGMVATSLAKEMHAWDEFGIACLDLRASYATLNRLDEAVYWWYEYLSKLQYYGAAGRLEVIVRYNLGKYYAGADDLTRACEMLSSALDAGRRWSNGRMSHAVRQALIEAYLRAGTFDPIPRLLAQSSAYLRHNKEVASHGDSYLFLLKMRADFAVSTRRYTRARLLAVGGLEKSQGKPRHEYEFHLVLAEVARQEAINAEAIGHLLSARAMAVSSKRHDLESHALRLLYAIESDFHSAEEIAMSHYLTELGEPN